MRRMARGCVQRARALVFGAGGAAARNGRAVGRWLAPRTSALVVVVGIAVLTWAATDVNEALAKAVAGVGLVLIGIDVPIGRGGRER